MSDRGSHLNPTETERRKLRTHKIRVKEIHHHPVKQLQEILDVSKIRAMELYALSEFQSVPSVGIRFANDLVSLGYYSLKQLKAEDPTTLLAKFERQLGVWSDPCVEDQFRLVVHYARNPGSKKNWWDFTAERKAYREANGYPASRPEKPWYELPQFRTANHINAAKEETKNDLHQKLKKAISFMKKDLSSNITVREMADVAALSQYHFIRSFKDAYEVTPGQFLTKLRLKKASLLLKKSELNISEIMMACGFEDKSSFIRLFRKELGQTPMQYRGASRTQVVHRSFNTSL
jgi:AraC-like DNA-binding protein